MSRIIPEYETPSEGDRIRRRGGPYSRRIRRVVIDRPSSRRRTPPSSNPEVSTPPLPRRGPRGSRIAFDRGETEARRVYTPFEPRRDRSRPSARNRRREARREDPSRPRQTPLDAPPIRARRVPQPPPIDAPPPPLRSDVCVPSVARVRALAPPRVRALAPPRVRALAPPRVRARDAPPPPIDAPPPPPPIARDVPPRETPRARRR